MAAPQSLEEFVEGLSSTDLLSAGELETLRTEVKSRKPPPKPEVLADELVKAGKITKFQAMAVCAGKVRAIHCGEYVLLDKIGAGGMGQVFKARHRRMKRIVAVKLLTPRSKGQDQAVKRFYQEVELAGRLVHPNIVTAYDAGEANNLHYLVMEFVEGQDLSSTLKPDKRLPLAEALDIILQAARGLHYAHSQGIVHRDIKPSNLLRDDSGNVKILDMGLARSSAAFSEGENAAREGLTQSGEVMGTVDYMAPEQARNTREADGRADIYSLGCTLFRLVTGGVPYKGDSIIAKIMAHCEQPIPSISTYCPQATPRVDKLFQRMLAKAPEDRFATAGEVVAEVEACVAELANPNQEKPLARPRPAPERPLPSPSASGSSVRLDELPNVHGGSGIGRNVPPILPGSSAIGRETPAPGPSSSVLGSELPPASPGSSGMRSNVAPAAPRARPAPRTKEPAPVESTPLIQPIITTGPSKPAMAAGGATNPPDATQMKTALVVGGGVGFLLLVGLIVGLIVAFNRPAEDPTPVVVVDPNPVVKPVVVEPKPIKPTPTPAPTPTPFPMPMIIDPVVPPPMIEPPVIPPPIDPEPMPRPMLPMPEGPMKPTRMNARANLLAMADLKRDSVEGIWSQNGLDLTSSTATVRYNRIQFPFSPIGEYELRATFSARNSGGHFGLGLPTQGGGTMLLVDRTPSTPGAGLHLRGAAWNSNRTTVSSLREVLGSEPISLVCRVQPGHITVAVNGRTIIDWEGDPSELAIDTNRFGPDPTKFCLQTPASEFTFSQLEVIPLSEEPAPIPEGDDLSAATTKAAELAGPALPPSAAAQQKVMEAYRLQLLAAPLNDPAVAYVLLQRAIDLAVAGDNGTLACALSEDIGRFYEEDGIALLRGTLAKIAALPKTPSERLEQARGALLAAEGMTMWERYDEALELIQWSSVLYTKSRDLEQAKEAKVREQECKARKTLFQTMQAAKEKLATDPAHAESHAAIGDYFAVAKGLFDDALPHLGRSSVTEVRTAALLEQSSAADPNKAGAIGEAWAAAAEEVPAPIKSVYFQHARDWLERGTAGVAAPTLKKLAARILRDEQDSRRLTGGVFLKRHPLDAIAFNGHWYKFYSSPQSWWGARRSCRELGGDLVCVESPAEFQFLSQFAATAYGKPDIFYFWIGASEEGHEDIFLWVNGVPVQFAAWAPNAPNRKKTYEGAVRMSRDGTGSPRFVWHDIQPGQNYYYICEWDR